MTWNPPPQFNTGDTPTLSEWNQYITSTDAIQTRFRPAIPAFVTKHNAFLRPVGDNALNASHTIPLAVTPTTNSYVGFYGTVITAALEYDTRLESFRLLVTNVGSSYNLSFGTLTFNLTPSGVFTVSCTVAIRFTGVSIVILM